MSEKLDGKSWVLLLAVAFGLVIGLSDYMTGNVFKKDSLYYLDRGGNYLPPTESPCDRFGGNLFVPNSPKFVNGREIELLTLSDDVGLVRIDNTRRAIEPGHEVYIDGVYVTLFATGTNNACLIIN